MNEEGHEVIGNDEEQFNAEMIMGLGSLATGFVLINVGMVASTEIRVNNSWQNLGDHLLGVNFFDEISKYGPMARWSGLGLVAVGMYGWFHGWRRQINKSREAVIDNGQSAG